MTTTTVFTNGVFDLLGVGHLYLLEAAAEMGDSLIVGINSDASARRLKGRGRPIRSHQERAICLRAVKCVTDVVVFEEDTPARIIEAIKPDVLVKGGDYTTDDVVGASFVESYGGRVQIVPFAPTASTTDTIEKVRGGGLWPGPYPEGTPWIGVDLDGTLAYYEKGYSGKGIIGAPIREIQEMVLDMISKGVNVAIFTARVSHSNSPIDHRRTIEAWCVEHLGRLLPVTCRKDWGMTRLYDDRAYSVGTNSGVVVRAQVEPRRGDLAYNPGGPL